MDYTTLTDEELDQHRRDVLIEQERRYAVANLPAQIEAMSARYYRACGLGEPPVEAAQKGIANAKAASGK